VYINGEGGKMYIIYDKETTMILPHWDKVYATEADAKRALTRVFVNGIGLPRESLGVAELGYFRAHIEKQVTKRNLLSKKEFTQPVNTPGCCDPSTEQYWSM